MQFIGRPLEALLSAAFLLMALGVVWPPDSFFSDQALPADVSDPYGAAGHAALVVFLALVCVARPRQMTRAILWAWPILPVIGLAFASALWSAAPDLVFRRAAVLAVTTLFAVYLVARFEIPGLVSLLVKLNGIAAIGCFIVVALLGDVGLDRTVEYSTAWRGVYGAKNTLGGMSAFGIIIAVYAFRQGYGSRLISGALIPVNLVLLYLSQSGTPLAVLVAAAFTAAIAAAFRKRSGPGLAAGVTLLVLGLIVAGAIALAWPAVLAAVHRDPTLTGRSDIWRMSIGFIADRPWLGYGYGAFWRQNSPEARTIWQALQWLVPHAHNAWIEIGLELGLVGVAAACWLWLDAFYRAGRVLTTPQARHVVFCLALLTAMLVENITECEFLRPDSYLWLLFVAAFAYLGREAMALHWTGPKPKAYGQALLGRQFGA